jgi:hypothetical protein
MHLTTTSILETYIKTRTSLYEVVEDGGKKIRALKT